MRKFTRHSGVAAPLLSNNVDTDAIIPSREMKRVSKKGLGESLFAGWRYQVSRTRPNPEFVLNRKQYSGASILLTGENFGCGSSREHAVWALADFGIRAIVAPSFATIFHKNCIRNGILPVQLAAADIAALDACSRTDPQTRQLHIDLPSQTIKAANTLQFAFEIRPWDKRVLLLGLDPIAQTEQYQSEIDRFSERQRQHSPWIQRQK